MDGPVSSCRWELPCSAGLSWAQLEGMYRAVLFAAMLSALSTSMPCPAGDMNPIHLHPVLARLFGFKSNIAHGHLVLSQALAAMQAKESGKPWSQA